MTEFDHFADEYDTLLRDPIRDRFASAGSAFFHQRKRDIIRESFKRRNVDTRALAYLDVGCGKGDLLDLLRADFQSAAGCDPSRQMIAGSADDGIRVQVHPTEIPFEKHRFDFVTAVCVYHHVPLALRKALTCDIARTLKTGGVACIIEHNPFNPITRLIVRRTPVDADAILLPLRETAELMRVSGLRVIEHQYFLYLPESLYRIAGPLERLMGSLPLGGQYAVFAEKV